MRIFSIQLIKSRLLKRKSPSSFFTPINKGFTLIEVMIVVAIVGILVSIALPSYDLYIMRSKRADA